MDSFDIYLIVIFTVATLVGFFWGAMRSLLLLGVWLAAFLVAAHVKIAAGSLLARQWFQFDPAFNEMAAFGLVFVGIVLVAPVLIFIGTKGDQSLTRWPLVDDLIGALFAFAAAVLAVAAVIIVLETFYGTPRAEFGGNPQWTADFHASLTNSAIGSSIQDRLLPLMEPVLRLLIPADVAEAMR